MEVISLADSAGIPLLPPTVTALGLFDGVHLGHRALLTAAVRDAGELGCAPAALTFDDASVSLKPGAERLTRLEDRLALFEACGIAYTFVASFENVREETPARFVKDVLVGLCRTRRAVCGENFRFGAGAAGTPAELCRLMESCGGDARVVPSVKAPDGTLISSTAVREALAAGDMERAEALLGHPYTLTLPVEHGKALGRTIGLPTINQSFPPRFALPAFGVYISSCTVDGKTLPSVTNVGVRPTVGGERANCETHLLDYSGWLYGQTVALTLRRRLRGEIKFDSLDALRAQITQDICEVKNYYGID